MVKLVVTRKGQTLYCANPSEALALEKLPQNVDLNATITKARSVRQNNTYFGICGYLVKHGPEFIGNNWPNYQKFSDMVQIHLGYTETLILSDGTLIGMPRSKNFEEMPQHEFNEYFEKALNYLYELCGYDVLEAYKLYLENRG